MAISLSDAAKRFGMETKKEAQDKTAPTSLTTLTPEQLEEGKKGYEKFIEDQKNNMPWYDKVQKGIEDIGSSIRAWAATKMLGSTLNPIAYSAEKEKELPYAASPAKPTATWSEEERNTFGYLYSKDPNEAARYAIRLHNAENEQKQQRLDKITQEDASNPIMAVAKSIQSVVLSPTAALSGLEVLNDYAVSKQYGETVKTADYVSFLNGQGSRGAIAEQLNSYGTIDNDAFAVGGKGLGDLYSLGMSIADSFYLGSAGSASKTGKALSMGTYFSVSANEGYRQAIDLGIDPDNALTYGTIVGATECIVEQLSDANLFNIGKDGAKSLYREVLEQMVGEGAEEMTSAIVDILAQNNLFGENSEYSRLVSEYMSQGMSRKDAKNKATVTLVGNVVYATLSGAVSGGVSGSIYAGAHTLSQNAIAKQKYGNGADVAKRTLERVPDSTFAQNMVIKTELGNELTGGEINKLLKTKNDADVESVRLAIANRLMAKGENGKNIPALTQIILNKALGGEPSPVQNIRLKNSNAATQVLNEIDPTNMLSGNFDSQWAIDAGINKLRDVSGVIQTALAEANKEDVAEGSTTALNLSTEAREALRGKFTGLNSAYTPQSENTHIHTDEIKSTTLDAKQTAQIRAIERVANALGVDFYIYESEYSKKDGRKYVDKDGNVITDSGYYDPRDNSIHIDLHAGQNGEGTMLYTASHELVHWIKKSAADQFEALKDFVLGSLKKEGVQIETLIEKQIDKAKQNKRDMDRDGAIEEIVADACMTVLSTDAGIKAVTNLKTENKGLWNALKRFFTQFFNRIDKMYKGVKVDSEEGQYLADMHETAKKLRDLFVEGAQTAAKSSETKQTKTEQEESFEKSYLRSKNIKSNARLTAMHRAKLAAMSDSASAVTKDKLLERYDAIAKVWNEIGGELNSNFLEAWNNKEGKDRVFTIFKAQSGYKYNVELSSMCKKGIPLFEAIDTIVREEILNQLETKTLGKAEKEILYDLLKERGFDIPCAICYVEQARQREGAIIDAFLDGKIEKSKTGKVTQFKIGWNETYDALEKGMKSLGVDYKFPTVDRSIATDNYKASDAVEMDAKTQDAFYSTLLALINKEIRRYNSVKDAKAKARMPLKSITPSEIKRCLSGTLGSNLKLYKTIATNPASRFRIESDLLYSSMTTTNLATAHPQLYSLFNSQGGVSTFKTKQATAIYWADILNKKWDASKLRKEGGVRNQSNSDFMMYTLLDHAQMYIDFTAKGYYLQAYTKVLAELKLFGLSRGKINASFIPKVTVYYNEDGTVDYDKTRENAGLDENGNPIYDDIEGVNHAEAFMLLEDAEYSKSIGGICIGYSDKHIAKLLDDKRIQQIIGFHDKTDDPTKRYRGARYAKNYNGENEAQKQHSDGTLETIHIGFNQYVIAAEKLFKKDKATETFSGVAEYKGKQYNADDIPMLAADMYLEMCREKNYIPAYQQFASHPNYYKLLADFSLKDANGHYAPHQKVAYNMPDVVPYLDENGTKQYMPTRDYIKQELKKELTVRDDIAAALSDHSEEGLIPQFVERVNALQREKEIKHSARKRITPEMDASYLDAVNRGDMETAQRMVDEAAREAGYDSPKLYHGTSAFGFTEIDTKKSNDRISFFATDSIQTAGTYSGTSAVRNLIDTSESSLGIYQLYANTDGMVEFDAKGAESNHIALGKAENDYNNVVYGKSWYTFATAKQLAKYAKQKGHAGVIIKNVVDSATPQSRKTVSSANVYIFFASNQVKSADPITYDDNGNVIPLSERFNSEQSDIRYSSRKKRTVTLSVGEEAKFRANYTRSKVFSKSNMYRIIEKFASKGELTAKTTEELADDMWISFNSATSVEERREFAHSTAQFVVSKLLQESKSQSKEAKAATEQLLYLKGGIRRIDFTPDEITEIRFKKDESGLKSIRARWGYHKSHTNAKVRPYPLDVFVTDVAREVPGMAYLADMNHVDAFFEIADMYDTLKAKVKDRWVSNYAETSNSDLDALQMEIEQTIFDAYITEGEQSKFGKFVSAKLDAYKERTEYWKAAYDNFKDRSRLENLITYKAQKMEDLKKGTFLNATQYGNADAFKDSIEKLSSLKFRGAIRKPNAVRDIFKPILAWYTKDNPMLIDPKADEASPHKYSYEVAAMLEVIANGENGLSNDELAAIYEIMNYFTKFIETYNKVWRNGKWEDAIGIATTDIEIMQHVAKSNTMSALKRAANKYAELFSEPMFVARMSDGYQNGFFTQTMTELREAAKNAAIAEMEVREDYDKFLKEHPEYVEKASTEMVEFKGVQIPKMQLISLYMTYHRKHAQAGLIFNGFKFTTQPTKVGEVARTIAIPGATSPNADLSQAEFNSLVKMEITLIRSKLNATDKEYIKMLEGLYNGQLRALKIQRDMDRLGFTNATLDYYYPIRRATIAKSIDTTVFEDVNRATNSSFNKNTVKGARQQLFIESADTLINKHIHEICNYAYMSGAIENYNVIYNLDVSGNPNNPVSVRTTIEATNLWTSSQKYFHKLVKDMQGIKSGDDTVINSALGWLRSGYVKFQLGLNLKTIASQASSIYAATNVLDYGSIVKGMGVDATGVDDYCAYAKLRHYDKSAIKAMTVTEKIGKKTEWVTAGIETMDRLIITKLFGACQVQAEKNGAGKIGTEENKIAAGKLLEKVILDTQSNALATEKSSAMRSESEVAKMLTMFRADSMKVVTRVFESVGELRMLKANNASETEIKGAQVKVAKSVASLVMVSAFMATLAQLFRWIYNKEQDEDRVLVDVALDFAGNLLSGVPLLSDLWDYFIDGFEPSSMALDVVFTLAGGVNSITKDLFDAIFSEDKPSRQKIMRDLRTVLYGACQFAGIPVRNVYNMVTGVIGNISSKAEYRIDDFFNENNYYSDLKEAIEKEDLAKVDLLFSLAYGKQFGNSVSDATVEELNRLAKLGKDYRVLPKTIPDKITRDGIEYELTDNQKQDILAQYEKVNAAIDKLITLSSYKSLSDEKKVERLKYYYDKYFDLAVTSALGLAKSNEQLMYSAVGFDTYAKFHFATKGIKSDKDKNGNTISGSKRKKTIQAIDKLKLPEEKRLILIASKGYALTENERSKLVRYINGLKLSATTKNALAELCGFEVKNGKIVNK